MHASDFPSVRQAVNMTVKKGCAMMKNRQTRSLISLILAITMLLTGSMLVYAVDLSDLFGDSAVTELQLDADCQILKYVDEEVFLDGGHVARLKEEETLSTYVFLNSDGTRTVYYMDENVKFRDENGAVQEKDISLTATTQGFATTRNDVALSLPTNLAQGVTMSYGGYDVTLIPQNISTSTTVRQQDSAVLYANCFGHNTGLIYTPTLSGLKEDILLGKYTGVNSFTFLLNTDGLNVYQNEQGRYYLAQSADAEMKMEMADIVAYDANTRHCLGEMTVTPITAGQQYQLTVTIDEDFLTAETTAYPVFIDPTITVSDNTHGAGAIEDSTIYSGKPTLNTATWQYNRVGYYDDNYKIGRTVIHLASLVADSTYKSLDASQLLSVVFYAKEGTGTASAPVELRALTSYWPENQTNWNSVNGHASAVFATANMINNQFSAFNITGLAKSWKNGIHSEAEGSFILVGQNEATVDKTIYSSEFSTTDRRPYVVVNYTLDSTIVELDEGATTMLSSSGITGTITWASDNTSVATVSSSGLVSGVKAGIANITATVDNILQKTYIVYVTIADGVYYIRNNAASLYLGAEDGNISNNTDVELMSKYGTYPERYRELWKIKHIANGIYSIRPMHKLDMALHFTATNADICTAGTADSLSNLGEAFRWTIEYDTNGYVIKNNGYYARALIANGTTAGTSVTTATHINSSACKWYFESRTVPNDLLLYDTRADELVTECTDTSVTTYVTTCSVAPDQTLSLSALGLAVGICDPDSNSQTVNWTSSNPSIATINMTTGQVTGVSHGVTTIYAARVLDGVLYKKTVKLVVCDLPVSGYEVPYQPELWNVPDNLYNDYPTYLQQIESTTNCYAYALNAQVRYNTNEIWNGHPGSLSSEPLGNSITAQTIIAAVQRDSTAVGFTFIDLGDGNTGANATCPPNTYKVMLAVMPSDGGYHWYRQNPDGTWSHKMLYEPVTNKQQFAQTSSSVIWNPKDISMIGDLVFEDERYFFAVSPINQMYTPPSN